MSPVERAKADLIKMQAELTRLQQRIDKVRAYIEMAAIYENAENGDATRTSRGGNSNAVARAAIEFIRQQNQRMHTRPLMEALMEQGVHIGGSNPAANLSAVLSRSDELNSNRALGWGLAEWEDEPDERQGVSRNPARTRAGALLEKIGETDAITSKAATDLDDEVPV